MFSDNVDLAMEGQRNAGGDADGSMVGLDTSGRRRDTDRRGRARRLSDRGARRLHIRLYEDQRGHMAGIGTCSCSIDVIASILPYDRYIAAETFLSLSQVPGRFGTMFQSPEQARAATNDLRRAQAEAEVRCF